MGRTCGTHWIGEKWVGFGEKASSRKQLRHGWDYKIKIYLKENVGEGVDWIKLAKVRIHWNVLMSMVLNCIPSNVGNVLTEAATVSFSRRPKITGAGS